MHLDMVMGKSAVEITEVSVCVGGWVYVYMCVFICACVYTTHFTLCVPMSTLPLCALHVL